MELGQTLAENGKEDPFVEKFRGMYPQVVIGTVSTTSLQLTNDSKSVVDCSFHSVYWRSFLCRKSFYLKQASEGPSVYYNRLQVDISPPVNLSSHLEFVTLILCTISIHSDSSNPRYHDTVADSFPVPTYLFFKGNERLGRNDVKVAGQAGKGERKVAPRFSCGLPLMQRVLVKSASGATGNESDTVEALPKNTSRKRTSLLTGPPSQNLIFLNSHTKSEFLHSRKRSAPVSDTFFAYQGCPFTRELPLHIII